MRWHGFEWICILVMVLLSLQGALLEKRINKLEWRLVKMEKEAFKVEGARRTAIALLYGEARQMENHYADEIAEATAILCVVRNRAKNWVKYNTETRYEQALLNVMLDYKQFSVFNEKDVNSDKSYDFISEKQGSARYKLYENLVDSVLFGDYPDITQGADHYVAKWLYNQKEGWWSRMTVAMTAGGHKFLL